MGTQTRPEGKARSFGENIESDLASRFLRVVEVAAIASARTMGQGERKLSDQVATEAMRRTMDTIPMRGTIVIGEGERDEAPMLYIGEPVGARLRRAWSFRAWTSPSILWRAPTCAPPAPQRDGRAGRVRARRPAARARLLHGEDHRRPGLPRCAGYRRAGEVQPEGHRAIASTAR